MKKYFEKKFQASSFEIYSGALLSFDDYGEVEEWVKEELGKLNEIGNDN